MRILHVLLGFLAAASLILVLLITSIEAVVYWNPGYFEKEYEKYDVLSDVHMEMDDLLYVTDEMMAYLRGDREELQVVTVIDGQERGFFNEREIAHMEDVKVLFLGGLSLRRWALAIGILSAAVLCLRRQQRILPRAFACTTGGFLALAVLLGILISTDFTRYFTIFHHIFFDNDLWILNPQTDLLINIVPEPFFVDTALRIGLLFGSCVLIVLAVCLYLIRREKIRKNRKNTDGSAA